MEYLQIVYAFAQADVFDRNAELIPVGGGQGPEGNPGVCHLDVKFVSSQGLRQAGAKTPRSPGIQGRVYKIMPVEPLSHPGQKQTAAGCPCRLR